MSTHNLVHLFPEFSCAPHPDDGAAPHPETGAAPSPRGRAPGDDSADDGIVRAGLLYISGDLGELAKIASPERADELLALSQLMRALAAS